MVFKVLQGKLGLLELLVLKAVLAKQVQRGLSVFPGQRDRQAQVEVTVLKEVRVQVDQRVLLDHKGRQEKRVRQANMAVLALLARQDQQEIKDLQEKQGLKDPLAVVVQQVRLV